MQANTDEKARNSRFTEYFQKIYRTHARANNYEEAIKKAKATLVDALVQFVDLGKRESSRGKYNSGIALEWSRMSFQQRKSKVEDVVHKHLVEAGGTNIDGGLIQFSIQSASSKKVKVCFVCHCVPDSMSTSAARELVGQPFLGDYKYAEVLRDKKCYGPVHLIGVYKRVTELQAKSLLGFPDAVIANAPFGIYIADNVQKIQMVFLSDCRDESSTRHNLTRFLAWMEETGESDFIAMRATSRRKIVETIHQEQWSKNIS